MYSIDNFPKVMLGFSAYSGTGKTTLIEKLIPLLVAEGIKIGLIKHSHHDIEMDKPGKDSYRLRKAGASQVVLASPYRTIIFKEKSQRTEPSLTEQLNCLDINNLDLVLVEGFRDEKFAKIELHRPSLGKPLLYPNDQSIIAIAADQPLSTSLPALNINDIEQIKVFVLQYLLLKNSSLKGA
ncbi:MAG: molybdopterin-guanine dinucleotide biosynthesis protein B [Psychromonas sp.]|jgi:molybdopterin-guanine dinucleotide biosynthesis protein B